MSLDDLKDRAKRLERTQHWLLQQTKWPALCTVLGAVIIQLTGPSVASVANRSFGTALRARHVDLVLTIWGVVGACFVGLMLFASVAFGLRAMFLWRRLDKVSAAHMAFAIRDAVLASAISLGVVAGAIYVAVELFG
ncbi:MAG: hypothetical protein WD845_10215 [Pirellulales bacterium]